MKRILVLTALLVAPAHAQQQAPAVDRISLALGQCIGNFEQRIDEIAELRKQLASAEARVKALEEKEAAK